MEQIKVQQSTDSPLLPSTYPNILQNRIDIYIYNIYIIYIYSTYSTNPPLSD